MPTDLLTGPTILGAATRTKVYKNFIDGEWVEASTGQTFEDRNPADTRDVVGIFQRSGKEDVDNAVAAAKQAFAKWRLIPAPRRAEIIYSAAEMLMERKEEYARDMTREMGKILKETRGDVQEAVDTAYYMAGEGRRMFGPTTPSELPNKFAMALRQPIGVCWNDYAMEFSHGDSVVEAFAGAGVRQHVCDQAGAGYSAVDFQSGARALRCRLAEGRG